LALLPPMSLQGRSWFKPAGGVWPGLALGGILLLGACASGDFPVEAPAVTPVAGSIPYHLLALEPADAAEAAQHRQIVGFVRAALAAGGMHEVAREAAAERLVRLDYSVGPPHKAPVNETEPMYEITPGKIVDQSVAVGINTAGSTIYEMRKVKEPDVVTYRGERPVAYVRTVYEKRLRLTVRAVDEIDSDQPARELWSLELLAEGPSRNFRRMLPVLTGPGRPYLGQGATGPAILRINDDTGAIESIESSL
jgi:hypothetical protein